MSSDWQWATIKQQKLTLLHESSDAESNKQLLLDGNLEYLWRDQRALHHNKPTDRSQYAALLGSGGAHESPLKHNKQPQIFVSRGNYFGQHQVETVSSSSSSSSESPASTSSPPSWRTAGSEELAAMVAKQSVANCDLPPPSSATTESASLGSSSIKQSKSSDFFGEALCRSQSRAREAEKLAVRAFQEKDEVTHLFFKEASLSLAYRQWLILLQAENLFLMNLCKTSEAFSTSHKQLRMKKKSRRGNRPAGRWSDSAALLRCTLAFAVGLGLAGAGLMLGWSLGWILFAL